MIYVILVVYVIEWVLYDFVPDQWTFLLGSKILTCALAFTTLLIYSSKLSITIRSIIAWMVIDSWCDVIEFIVWQWSNESLNSTWLASLFLFSWLLFIIKRKYPERIDLIDMENINILILRPRNSIEIIKGLIGFPAASICIVTKEKIWSFRWRSGMFECLPYSPTLLVNHLVIDSKIKANSDIIFLLDNLIGVKRLHCIKCVYTIRKVLNKVGGKYQIKSWFDYVPGLYFMRII